MLAAAWTRGGPLCELPAHSRSGGKGCLALARLDEAIAAVPRYPRIRVACGMFAGLLVVLIAIFWIPLTQGNFGVVDPCLVFRSAQPGGELPRLIREHRLASILNLRGGSRADSWYLSEFRAARDEGLAFYDLPLSASRRPTRRELLILLDFFEHCPYPLLIHCKSGSDRTGLACVLYLMTRRGEPPEQAVRAFNLRYGHVPLFGPEHLHEPFCEYRAWLQSRDLAHTPARLRAWVEHDYRADDRATNVPHLQPGPRVLFEGGQRGDEQP